MGIPAGSVAVWSLLKKDAHWDALEKSGSAQQLQDINNMHIKHTIPIWQRMVFS